MLFVASQGTRNPISKAFLNVYLPVLLLLPQELEAPLPVLPDFTFGQATLLPIIIAYLILPTKHTDAPRGICLLDVLVVGFVAACVISEYLNIGMNFIQKIEQEENVWRTILYRSVFNILIPYYLARKLIYPEGLTPAFAKRIILFTLVSLLVSAYEWRFVINLHMEFVQLFFENVVNKPWIPTYRFGLVRISGPFMHPILFGSILAVGLIFNHWLMKNRLWKNNFSFLLLSSYSKGILFGVLLFIGLVLTFSRGPLYSSILAFCILGLGYTPHKVFGAIMRIILFAIIGLFIYEAISYYSGLGMDLASRALDRSAAYRSQLVSRYLTYVYEKPFFGWGTFGWPTVPGMTSIDNHFLWIVLKHGGIALGLQVLIFFITSFKLIRLGFKIPYKERIDLSLAFTLFSILFMLFVTLVTVFMGGQLEPMTFMIIGLSQGFAETYRARHRKLSKIKSTSDFSTAQI
jgi:hypothetical protein